MRKKYWVLVILILIMIIAGIVYPLLGQILLLILVLIIIILIPEMITTRLAWGKWAPVTHVFPKDKKEWKNTFLVLITITIVFSIVILIAYLTKNFMITFFAIILITFAIFVYTKARPRE